MNAWSLPRRAWNWVGVSVCLSHRNWRLNLFEQPHSAPLKPKIHPDGSTCREGTHTRSGFIVRAHKKHESSERARNRTPPHAVRADVTAYTAHVSARAIVPRHHRMRYRVTTTGHHGGVGVARVKTYGDVFEEYEWHPETKSADANGTMAKKPTVGLLQRRHIAIDHVIYIGRESNQLEDVEAGVVRASDGAYTEYQDPRRDYWRTVVRALREISLKAWRRDTGKSPVILIDARRGRRRPHARHRALLIAYARKAGLLR